MNNLENAAAEMDKIVRGLDSEQQEQVKHMRSVYQQMCLGGGQAALLALIITALEATTIINGMSQSHAE